MLPGISVLIGGMWIMNLSYWGFNQYIIQRALAAKSTREAQKGILFAAFLKMLMPVIVVLPGVAAVLLAPDLEAPDRAYPSIMTLLPAGILGLVFAALIAAIVSSLASMMNSIATIFTMDIYRHLIAAGKDEQHLVGVGRTVSLAAIVIALLVARPLLGNFDQAFQYIQEFTGFFTPGVCALFSLGIFWRRTTANGALAAAIGSAAFSIALKLLFPELPFIDRVGIVFLLCIATGMLVSSSGAARGSHRLPACRYHDVCRLQPGRCRRSADPRCSLRNLVVSRLCLTRDAVDDHFAASVVYLNERIVEGHGGLRAVGLGQSRRPLGRIPLVRIFFGAPDIDTPGTARFVAQVVLHQQPLIFHGGEPVG